MKKSKRRQTPQRRALRPRRTQPLKREVKAAELPVRYRAAVLQNITDRNERLSALKAAALRSDLQRIEAMMMDAPHMRQPQQLSNASAMISQHLPLSRCHN